MVRASCCLVFVLLFVPAQNIDPAVVSIAARLLFWLPIWLLIRSYSGRILIRPPIWMALAGFNRGLNRVGQNPKNPPEVGKLGKTYFLTTKTYYSIML